MCLAMNDDDLQPGERCASTSNRNFEGRQGKGGRTHLVSPPMAAAAAIAGHLVDVRTLRRRPGGGGLMQAFTRVEGVVCPLDRADVDTDQIIPKQFLKRIERTGFGEFLFWDWRGEDGFPLDRPEYAGAPILVAGAQLRLRLVARARALGARGPRLPRHHRPELRRHLPHQLPQDRPPAGRAATRTRCGPCGEAEGEPGISAAVDLERQVVVAPDGREIPFAVDPVVRERLLNGWDDIALTLAHEDEISATRRRGSARAGDDALPDVARAGGPVTNSKVDPTFRPPIGSASIWTRAAPPIPA